MHGPEWRAVLLFRFQCGKGGGWRRNFLDYILNFSPTPHHFLFALAYEIRNADGKLTAFPESVGGKEWKARFAGMGIRYLNMPHTGRLEGTKAGRIKQFREFEAK